MRNYDGLDAERHVRYHRVAINSSLQTPIRIALLITSDNDPSIVNHIQ